MKIRGKILSMVIIPAVTIGIISILVSSIMIKREMEDLIEKKLKTAATTAIEAYEFGDDGAYSLAEDGSVTKGDIILSENNEIVDSIFENNRIYSSLFYGDVRITTSVKDPSGNRVVGTKASDNVIEIVLNQGKDYFSDNATVGNELYYAYYIPLKQVGSDEVVGMFATLDKVEQVNKALWNMRLIIGGIILAIVLLSILIVTFIINIFTAALKRTVAQLDSLAEGSLDIKENNKDLSRKDEIGEIAHATTTLQKSLINIIKGISDTASVLLSACEELEQVAEQTATTTEGIEKAVDDIAAGALAQAESSEEASRQTLNMGEEIENTITAVHSLHQNAAIMESSSKEAMKTLDELTHINDKTRQEIDIIYRQTNETNDFAKKINEATNIIKAIADETNLLSLNASIEAARAGETGRGFAIVAEQIKKLAAQSSISAKQIETIVETLIFNSDKAVNTMQEVKNVIEVQNESLGKTKNNFETVFTGINQSTEQVNQIELITERLNVVRKSVIDIVCSLSAISEENAASSQETSASTTELSSSVTSVGSEIITLRNLADDLVKNVSIFKL